METVIVDTGPLVAYLCQDDQDHRWTEGQFKRFQSPLITCDAVVSEAMFLLARLRDGVQPLMELLDRDFTVYRKNLRQVIPLIFRED
jgi:predicted nucleic acid-binding protein